MKVKIRHIAILVSLLAGCFCVKAQSFDKQLAEARNKALSYDFDAAASLYADLLREADSSRMSVVQTLLLQCENGRNMLNFATEPSVLAVKKVPSRDFYLWYRHLCNSSWVGFPNEFVKEGGNPFYNALYFPADAGSIIFSAPDEKGNWHLLRSEKISGNRWSHPEPVSGAAVSQKDEIYPLLSNDGRKLYFSSNALAGMGGYDIYVCRLEADGVTWSAPENMGFPYSSPYDDFLYSDTPDGKYSIFASNRDCESGYMNIYVLAFENKPVRKSLCDLDEIRRIASLTPASGRDAGIPAVKSPFAEVQLSSASESPDGSSRASGAESSSEQEYLAALNRLESVRDSLSDCSSDAQMMELQVRLSEIQASVAELEMKMLEQGVVPPQPAAAEEISPAGSVPAEMYHFSKNLAGSSCGVTVDEPEGPGFGLKILKESEISEKNELPGGICYQIQLCVVSQKLQKSRLRGISPAFAVKQKSGKYVYYAGLFETYADAQEALPLVKKNGYVSAMIVAWKDGKSCQLSEARKKEKTK